MYDLFHQLAQVAAEHWCRVGIALLIALVYILGGV